MLFWKEKLVSHIVFFPFLPLHKRSIFPSGVTFKGPLCCVFSLDNVFWVIFSSFLQSYSILFFFYPPKIKNINLANTTLLFRTYFRKKNYLKISGSKIFQVTQYFICELQGLTTGQKGQKCMNATCVIQVGNNLKHPFQQHISIVNSFIWTSCWYSQNIMNYLKILGIPVRVLDFENLRILLGYNRSV